MQQTKQIEAIVEQMRQMIISGEMPLSFDAPVTLRDRNVTKRTGRRCRAKSATRVDAGSSGVLDSHSELPM